MDNNETRRKFESLRDKNIMKNYKWCDDEQIYNPVVTESVHYTGNHVQAEKLTNAFYMFAEGYQAAQPQWVSTSEKMPATTHEMEEWDYSGDNCTFHGMVSDSLEISDGYNLARGHYRDDGTWCIYPAGHDFQIVDPDKVTHWQPLPPAPHKGI